MLLDKRKERTVAIPTSSMADIAFLLLTFFLVTTSLDLDKGLQLTLPAKGMSTQVPKQNIVNLLINESGEVMLNETIIPIESIREDIKRRLAQNPALIVSIQTMMRTKYQVFVHVLDQVKRAEAGRISIAEPESS
jgi:biopolymer transport protein ExbD